jgi:hypothetical protein
MTIKVAVLVTRVNSARGAAASQLSGMMVEAATGGGDGVPVVGLWN